MDNSNASGNQRKKELISIIKFVGREYDSLTGIMDEMNHCYSLQVYNEHLMYILTYFCKHSTFQVMFGFACGFFCVVFTSLARFRYIFLQR